MRHPEHHHVPPSAMQRNRMNVQQMPPPQRMLMPVPGGPHAGVLVSMPSGPTLINTISPIQQHQTKGNPVSAQQVYYDPTAIAVAAEVPEMQASVAAAAAATGTVVDAVQVQTQPAASPQQQSQQTQQQQQSSSSTTNTTTSSNVPNLANMKEKTPMCLVNELARYNKIQHQYRLTGEQGPAHKKIFTVTLKLGTEEYEAEGASIKKAQHSAAAQALEKTNFRRPPPKTARNLRPGGIRANTTGIVTPTVELNALAMKRGERTVYIVENGVPTQPQGYILPNYYNRHGIYNPQGQPRYGYDTRRNHNMRGQYHQYDNRYHGQYKPSFTHANGEICTVRLRVGDRDYVGTGVTTQAARHDAATKAIEDIKKMNNDEGKSDCEENGKEENVSVPELNTELKSPISLVHEIALKRHLNVVFEVKSENGPPHMKVFVTQCKIGDIVVDGEGNGKKISKKRAAEKMLEKLAQLPPLPNNTNANQVKRKRVTTKKKTRNLIKVNSDKPNDFVEDINPISRLIQIQQANKEKEPVYTVLEERGAPRRREFVIMASINELSANGVGPNKKFAKRNAAQALLQLLGYSTPNANATSNTTNGNQQSKTATKQEKEKEEVVEKTRKVTFMEDKSEAPIGGSGGRQLVPGLLLVHDKPKTSNENSNYNADKKNNGTTQKNTSNTNSSPPQGVRSKDKLLYLAQLINIQVQFSDFPKANHEMYLTLVSLSTTPPQVCHGEGPTIEASHEKASLEALNVLSEMGLDNNAPSKESSSDA